MIHKTLEFVKNHKSRNEYLKSISPYFPQVVFHKESSPFGDRFEEELFASTLVRIEREGTWYTLHHVMSSLIEKNSLDESGMLLQRIINQAYLSQKLYILPKKPMKDVFGCDFHTHDVDKLQISEEERMRSTLI